MTSPITLHTAPSAGFDQPLDMLQACHERVARMLALLLRLHQHMAADVADEPARQAAVDLMRYFDTAMPHHHQDEERHVFPALRAGGDAALAALADRLQAEHRLIAADWAALRPGLQALAAGQWPAGQAAQARAAWLAYAELNASHAKDEDDIAYPAAWACLQPAQLATMGEEMARRRGLR